MLVAAAACPYPPLLVPQAMGAAGEVAPAGTGVADAGLAGTGVAGTELAGAGVMVTEVTDEEIADEDPADAAIRALRAACRAAVSGLAGARPGLVVIVGGAAQTTQYQPGTAGTLRGLGIPVTIGAGAPVLPLSLTIGSWLLRQFLPPEAGRPAWQVRLQAVDHALPPAACLRLGGELAASAPRVALLAMGDGSARRVLGVHGAADPVAERYDADVAAALAGADAGRLARLDPALDAELMVTGRAAWQVLAGAAGGSALRGQLRFAAAPLDVGYHVASWAA